MALHTLQVGLGGRGRAGWAWPDSDGGACGVLSGSGGEALPGSGVNMPRGPGGPPGLAGGSVRLL